MIPHDTIKLVMQMLNLHGVDSYKFTKNHPELASEVIQLCSSKAHTVEKIANFAIESLAPFNCCVAEFPLTSKTGMDDSIHVNTVGEIFCDIFEIDKSKLIQGFLSNVCGEYKVYIIYKDVIERQLSMDVHKFMDSYIKHGKYIRASKSMSDSNLEILKNVITNAKRIP